MLLNEVLPLSLGGGLPRAVTGAVIGAAGVLFTLSGAAAVVRHRTTIVPHRPVSTLITTGSYRFSRNPMYTGLAAAVLGFGILADTWWPLLLLPLALLLVTRLVIEPEERYLTTRFGQVYADYRTHVRRWL
ncbi:isoprenylcysteine carboxylmethyltransferase family protein [Nocardia blacklockiae]|nr:isoprenylcysteine carboxylmethyltransferase family protein [Nocardia blacklockiae]